MDTKPDLTERYIELLKKTLAFSLWEDPPLSLDALQYGGPLIRGTTRLCSSLFRRIGIRLVVDQDRDNDPTQRETGTGWPSLAHTMVGIKRLDNLQLCAESVLIDGIPGDFLETGVWRGGACIFMRGILEAHNDPSRRVFVADSFQGLPPPDPKYPADAGDIHHRIGLLAVSRKQVEDNFRLYGLLDDRVVFLEGWFKDTLPTAPIHQLSILRLDGDMYSSTMDVFNNLYHKLSPGGYCIIDDYGLPTCRQATDDFRKANGITEPIHEIDWTGVYWRKE